MGQNRRWKELQRGKPRLTPVRRILIVCEGEVTEPVYFQFLKSKFRAQLHVEIVGEGGAPETVVAKAIQLKTEAEGKARGSGDSFELYEQVWCVFDQDQHENVRNSIRRAKQHGIRVAFSNPCFEVWILLHFQDHRASDHRDNVSETVRNHIPNYVKRPPCNLLDALMQDAIERASLLEKWQVKSNRPTGNPITYVHRLVQEIVRLGEKSIVAQLKKR